MLPSRTTVPHAHIQLPRVPGTEVLCRDRLNSRRNNPTPSLGGLLTEEGVYKSNFIHSSLPGMLL